ncbi:hypothetical protein JHK87_039642 [Glycine soja]|nr:hypothetical protein JHK87_039642 [Glycine soja]
MTVTTWKPTAVLVTRLTVAHDSSTYNDSSSSFFGGSYREENLKAQKAQVGGATGADPQLMFTRSSYHVNNLEKVLVWSELVRDANGKWFKAKGPLRTYLICNPSRRLLTHVIYTSLPGSPFVVKELDDIMLEMESSHNFCSSVNGDGDNDVTEVYENDDDDEADGKMLTTIVWGIVMTKMMSDLKMRRRWILRKSHILRNTCRETLQQTFVCSCAAHRKMSDIIQIENYRKVGIRPPHMYVAFANHCGGYDKVGFIRKYIYNQEVRMRKQHTSDASGALKYLHDLRKKDPMMYVSYSADEGSRLQRLFCCDAESQLLYEVFGDVLAFDATYKKNKYLCPFVVFSSVNHHNQTIVFCAAIVTDETKETYVWLLEQFLEAMKGKTPC